MTIDDMRWDDDAPAMQFYYAVSEPDIEMVQIFLNQGMSADAVDHCGESVLERAAELGYVEVARLLLAHGANVNYQDGTGYTALKLAAEEGHLEMVNLLLDAGADMSICGGSDAGTPLHGAARCGQVEIVRLLLQRGADPNAQDMDGDTVSDLQRRLFLEERPEETSEILASLKSAAAIEKPTSA